MNLISVEQCKQVVKDSNLNYIGVRRCGICGESIGYHFAIAGEVLREPSFFGVQPDELVPGFDSTCGCTSFDIGIQPRSWEQFAETFNRQTPEHRSEMWGRFLQGKLLMD